MNTVRLVMILVVTSVLAIDCSTDNASSVESTTAAGIVTSTVRAVFVMNGVVRVAPYLVVDKREAGCDSDSRRVNSSARVAVSIADDQGVKVGAASLSRGLWLSDRGCQFTFAAEVKTGSDFYDVQIGAEDPITISAVEAMNKGFVIGYGYDW
ncbi:hypothetical protein RCF27_07175 [Rhodococcus pyridinivorans]|uniref:Uncharacterized protein n=1 Tax=Rhodococcus pyridinivorans TaxID=103816 RepID=A0A7M2XRB1_9NOCA|nr:hypothetical protein [Rhodococcus pyridinivorans]QOW00178.1 hypothetical protein INP59_07470 [Rhodococcus pyridinivorans]WMM74077.1 hypothetical protein RCF27_07175 [Rhodococcus pyridinivorans]